jgi:hypothetical protein
MKDHRWIKLSSFEMGYLFGAIPREQLDRMETEAPKLWLQIMIGVTETYAYSKGHPYQKRAWKELRLYKGRLSRILKKEEKYEQQQKTA